jgi:hypothetical protein
MKILKIIAIIIICIMNFYISSLIRNYGFDKIAIYDFSSFGEKANTLVYGALLMIIMSIEGYYILKWMKEREDRQKEKNKNKQ